MTALQLIPWICAFIMFGSFTVEGIASYFVLRDGHHRLGDSLVNIAITIGYVVARLGIGAAIGIILLAIYELTPLRWSMTHWWHWGVLFLLNDFLYYWSHRASHVYRVLWVSHVTHHSSPVLNLSTGLRNSWVGGALDWVFFVPTVALGFHPLALGVVVAIGSTIDFMAHTPYVGKLGFLDYVFNTPANHRVHHSKEPRYIDTNFGGALIIWDRLFGTYAAIDGEVAVGVDPAPARPYNPVYLEFHLWAELVRDVFRRRRTAA